MVHCVSRANLRRRGNRYLKKPVFVQPLGQPLGTFPHRPRTTAPPIHPDRTVEFGVGETRAVDAGIDQRSLAQVGAHEIHAEQIRAIQLGPVKIGATEHRVFQHGPAERRTAQVGVR